MTYIHLFIFSSSDDETKKETDRFWRTMSVRKSPSLNQAAEAESRDRWQDDEYAKGRRGERGQ